MILNEEYKGDIPEMDAITALDVLHQIVDFDPDVINNVVKDAVIYNQTSPNGINEWTYKGLIDFIHHDSHQ